ncbi:MAG: hypothetical protein HC803_10750 [Saprospiraceae bacterium]|nr:hypothetical protein [Saprospiraceae bacterium]
MNVPDTISPFGHLIFSQELIFYKNNIKIKSVNFPSKRKSIELQEKSINIFETSISSVKYHKRKDGFIYL